MKLFKLLAIVLSCSPAAFAQWAQTSNGIYGGEARSIIKVGNRLLVGTRAGVYVSNDNGAKWVPSNSGLTDYQVYVLAQNSGKIYAGTNYGVFVSSNDGASWSATNREYGYATFSIAFNGSTVFASSQGGVAMSSNDGASWTMVNTGLPQGSVNNLVVAGGKIYAGMLEGLYVSANNGATWAPTSVTGVITGVASNGTKISVSGFNDTWVSDDGTTWTPIESGFDQDEPFIRCFGFKDNMLILGGGGTIYFVPANATSWVESNISGINASSIMVSGENIFITTDSDVLTSSDNGEHWTAINNGRATADVRSITSLDGTLFAATLDNGIFLSGDNGATWTASNTGLPNRLVRSVKIIDGKVFAGTHGNGIYKSADKGMTWTVTNLKNDYIDEFISVDNKHFAVSEYKIYVSTDAGESWTPTSDESGLPVGINGIAANGDKLFAATYDGVFISSDQGVSWTIADGLPADYFSAIASNRGKIIIPDYSSIDNGISWQPIESDLSSSINTYAGNDDHLFAGVGYSGLVFYSSDNGATWYNNGATWYNTGADLKNTNTVINSLSIIGDKVYAATSANSLWSRSLSDFDPVIITSFTPFGGVPGVDVTINGTGFDPLKENMSVEFGGKFATINTLTPTSMTVTVHEGARTGKISVKKYGRETLSAMDFVVDMTLGLEDDQGVAVYPTITSDIIYVDIPNAGEAPVIIYNSIGKEHHPDQVTTEGKIQVNVKDLSPGLYFLRIPGARKSSYRFLKI